MLDFFTRKHLSGTFHVVTCSNLLTMINIFDKHCQEANRFVKSLAVRLGTPGDPEHTLRVLKCVLAVLRRRIVPDESLQLISRLPLIVKGVYVDGWNIYEPLSESNTLDEFLYEIRNNAEGQTYRDFSNDELARKKIAAVLNVLKPYVAEGELYDILHGLSREVSLA